MFGRSSSKVLRTSRFLICLSNPVLHMLCVSFSKSESKMLSLDCVNGKIFLDQLNVWCGREDYQGEQRMEISLAKQVGFPST